jgi:hypothetical protein
MESVLPMTADEARKTEPTAKYYTTDAAAPGADTPTSMTCESPTGEKRQLHPHQRKDDVDLTIEPRRRDGPANKRACAAQALFHLCSREVACPVHAVRVYRARAAYRAVRNRSPAAVATQPDHQVLLPQVRTFCSLIVRLPSPACGVPEAGVAGQRERRRRRATGSHSGCPSCSARDTQSAAD